MSDNWASQITWQNLIIGILTSLVAAGIVAAVSRFIVHNTKAQVWLQKKFRRSLSDRVRGNPKQARKSLIGWLRSDQDKRGAHLGQFGNGANLNEEKLFQTSREKLEAKPRLYLTGWPCFVLNELGFGNDQISLAVNGIERLLKQDLIEVSLGASAHTPPDTQPTIISYRHTIRAIQILARVSPNHPSVSRVVGRMLDQANCWQNPDGGWKQCDKERTDSDLWGSSYALALLADLLRNQQIRPPKGREQAHTALSNTMNYLKEQWHQNKWQYGGASSEQNGVQIFHETVSVFKRHDKLFFAELCNWIRSWLDPNGLVREAYYQACREVTIASANARVGYALFLIDESSSAWKPLALRAIDGFEAGVNSADAAFLLHMVGKLR